MAGRFYYVFTLILLLSWVTVSAQERKIVQFSGLISSVGGELPVPFVTVTNVSYNNQVHAANNERFFSFVVHVEDTIKFTSVGFELAEFVINETASDKFTAKINMKSLVIEQPAIMPFPWASI